MPTPPKWGNIKVSMEPRAVQSYRKAKPEVRKMWNRAFFDVIGVRDGAVADFTYEEPFASLLGSHKGSMVVPTGFDRVSTLRG